MIPYVPEFQLPLPRQLQGTTSTVSESEKKQLQDLTRVKFYSSNLPSRREYDYEESQSQTQSQSQSQTQVESQKMFENDDRSNSFLSESYSQSQSQSQLFPQSSSQASTESQLPLPTPSQVKKRQEVEKVNEDVARENQAKARATVYVTNQRSRREFGKGRTAGAGSRNKSRKSEKPLYSESWNPREESARTPRCKCSMYAKLLTVSANTENKGKEFFACSEQRGSEANCSFFMWKTNYWNEVFEREVSERCQRNIANFFKDCKKCHAIYPSLPHPS